MKKILLFLLTIIYFGVFAQNHNHNDEGHHCGMPIAYQLLEQEGKLQAQVEWYQNAVREFQANKQQLMNRSINEVYQVPVVVHVIWDNANGVNVTDAQIDIMMDNLNKDYARTNADAGDTRALFLPDASSVDIQFCLAHTDPNGLETTGITRVETTHGVFDPDAGTAEDIKSTGAGGEDSWDTQRYLNIWIGDLTGGTGSGTVGYSTMPGSHGTPNDGFIMDCVAVAAETLDRTPTHEIGHYFGLNHPWTDQMDDAPDCAFDDGFADTPNCSDKHLGLGCSPTPEPNSCDEGAGDVIDQFENFMGYANCTNMFTNEQAAFMKATLEGTRASLLGTNLCNTPVLTADFTPDVLSQINTGQTITFVDASEGPNGVTTWDWTFEGGTPATANTQGPHIITYNTQGTYNVSLTVGDGVGTDTKTNIDSVEVSLVLNANFNLSTIYAAIGEDVTFTDASIGPDPITTWEWNLGDATIESIQGPIVHSYTTEGLYDISLRIGDGTNVNTEIKTAYLEIYDPLALNIDSFIGTPTVINVDENVNFKAYCNQSDNEIDSVRWFFEGADVLTSMQTNTNSFNISYSTGGVFDVECRVYRNNGADGDTLIKQDYIVVISPDSVPVANFVATSSNIEVGSTIDFINLTNIVDQLDSCKWFINDGATTIESTDINPAGITYNTVGDWDVQLLVYSPFGNHDTLKVGYIHVFDPANPDPIYVNFEAISTRIITVGEAVQFQDLSIGDIQTWEYIFDRGAGDFALEYEYIQNPSHTFVTPGIYDVTLIASNSSYSDTLTKGRYIVVATTPWPETYCDTIKNILQTENILTFREAEYPSWGYFPGHYAKKTSPTSSEKKLKRYAEKFETYTPDNIAAVLLPVAKAYSGDNDAIIRIQIWDADVNGKPNNILTGYADNKIKINSLEAGIYNYIELDNPIDVDSVFFVGFRLDYETTSSPQDTFVVHMVPSRPLPEDNRIYVSRASSGEGWETPTEFLEFELNSSIGMKLMGCLVNVPEIKELEASISIYPNPASDRMFIDFGDLRSDNIKIEIIDIVGKKINSDILKDNYSNKFEINLTNYRNGFYLVNITVDGYQITKKILIQK